PPPGSPVPPPGPPSVPPSQSPPPTTTPPAAPPVFNSAAAVASALTEIDTARTTSGAGALEVDPVLVTAATKHTGDMVKYRTFSHTGPDGSSPYSRAQSLGCWTLSKELIARGRPGDDVVGALLRNWQAGPALLSPLNKSVGVAAQLDPATGDVYWTIELAWL
ncbi:MAG: CAP domain-containing protein, partial [Catenulispora sp.]|nr:CAP domain-containing protein [Catenulispora sp.]